MELSKALSFCKRRAAILLFLLGITQNIFAQNTASIQDSTNRQALIFLRSSYCLAPFLYPYEPEKIRSISILPDSVLLHLEAYLINRLGKTFYSDIVFNAGEYVDLQALANLERGTTNRKWVVATYYLCFKCQHLQQDGSCYSASVELDAKGNVILPVNLPYISQNTYKARIISWQSATEITRRNGIKKAVGLLSYSPQLDVMVWCFNQSKSIRPGLTRKKSIYIHANSGAILKRKNFISHYAPF